MDMRGGEVVVVFLLLCGFLFVRLEAELNVGYYNKKCPKAETIVRTVVEEAIKADKDMSAYLLRMHFHDCFVRGCDASILLDSTKGKKAEKDSPINNPSLEGFDVIDKAKSKLEATCKGVVSCADILTFATRDGIHLAGGPYYDVPSGRKDGSVSKASETFTNLPDPKEDLAQLTKLFGSKGFTQEEMITLSGGHTIGKSHCSLFQSRLYNFSSKAKQDPSLDSTYATKLKKKCPKGSADTSLTAPLDLITPDVFDNKYYKNVLSHRVVFTSDQTLLSTAHTRSQVERYADNRSEFEEDFVDAMVKLGMTGVITGSSGQVRQNCRVVNRS